MALRSTIKATDGVRKIKDGIASTTPLKRLKKQTASTVKPLAKALGKHVRLPISLRISTLSLIADSIRKPFANTAFAGPNPSNDLSLNKNDTRLIRRLLRATCSSIAMAVEHANQIEEELFDSCAC